MKKALLILSVFFTYVSAQAQLEVWEETNDTLFIYSLAGPGVTITNLERNCADGASGFYNSLLSNVGIDSGIALSSGSLTGMPGPNNSGATSTANMYDGDADLDALLPGYITYDACYIEFDMTVAADTVRISYVFGSEEYLEFVGSSFNDVFAFWVSGPGIPDPVNIATIPGTDLPVAINNVNSTSYSDFYVENGDGFSDPYASDPFYVQFDGLTTVLTAEIAVTAGETYHMKIAVADAGDYIFDSGVYLQTGSLGSLRMGTGYYGDGEALAAAEDCANGYIEFTNYVPSDMDLVIDYHISGTAEMGIDYETIAEQITIPAGMSTALLPIIPIADELSEGDETIVLSLYNPQSGYVYEELTFLLADKFNADFTFTVSDATYNFTNESDDAISWLWDFGDGNYSEEENPVHVYGTQGSFEACLTVTNSNNCSDVTCRTISVTTGLTDLDEDQLQIYPNPANQWFTIDGALSADVQISCFDVRGSLIASWTANTTPFVVDCSAWTPGIYLLKWKDANGYQTSSIEVK